MSGGVVAVTPPPPYLLPSPLAGPWTFSRSPDVAGGGRATARSVAAELLQRADEREIPVRGWEQTERDLRSWVKIGGGKRNSGDAVELAEDKSAECGDI